MATLSLKLTLSTTWQSIGTTIGLVGEVTVPSDGGRVELVNADALPSGAIDGSLSFDSSQPLRYPAPDTGDLYIRVSAGAAVLNYYKA